MQTGSHRSVTSSTDAQVSVHEKVSGNQNVIGENDEDDEFQLPKKVPICINEGKRV